MTDVESQLRRELRAIHVPDEPAVPARLISSAMTARTRRPGIVAPLAAAAAVVAVGGSVAALTLPGAGSGPSGGARPTPAKSHLAASQRPAVPSGVCTTSKGAQGPRFYCPGTGMRYEVGTRCKRNPRFTTRVAQLKVRNHGHTYSLLVICTTHGKTDLTLITKD